MSTHLVMRQSRGLMPRRSVPIQQTPTPPIVGDTANAYVEPRLLLSPDSDNVQFICNFNNAGGPYAPFGGTGFDENGGSGGSLVPPTRSFVASPALYNGADIGNVEKLRFPLSETNVLHDQFLGYGQYCRRRFSSMGLATFTDLYFRYAVYIPAGWHPWDAGKLPSLACVPDAYPLAGSTGMSGASVYNEYSWWAGIMWAGPSPMASYGGSYTGDSNLDHIRIHCYIYAKQIQGTTYTQAAVSGGLRGYSIKARAGLNQDETVANAGGSAVTGPTSNSYLYMNRGAWNTIEQHVTMNDSGSANGKYRLWLNDVLAINIQNIKWAADAYNSTSIINMLMNDTFYGGPTANASAQDLYLADYVMSSAYIGPRES